MFHRIAAALLAVVMLSAFGCAVTPSADRNIRVGTEAGTLLLIQRADVPAAKAVRVLETIKAVRAKLDASETVSVSDLRVILVQRITERYALNPAEQLLALEVINSVGDQLEAQIGKAQIPADARVTIGKVLDTAEQVARLYVPN